MIESTEPTRDAGTEGTERTNSHGEPPKGARFGTRRALFEIDPTEYESTTAAVRAALANTKRYVCDRCGFWRFADPHRCPECSGEEFTHRRLSDEERRRGRA